MTLIVLAGALTLLLALVYLYFKWSHSYWKRLGVPYIDPLPFYGNIKEMMQGKTSSTELFAKFYKHFKSKGYKHGGIYIVSEGIYLPVDLEIIKSILQTDFGSFVNHGTFINEEGDPLTGHLFNLENEKWRSMRIKLTPTFTSGKMKMMYHTMLSCTSGLKDILKEYSEVNDAVEIREVVSRFTTDIIGSCAFGIDCNSLKNPNSEFRQYGKKIFDVTALEMVKRWMFFMLPRSFMIKLGLKETDSDVEEFFMNVVKDSVKYREENNVRRKDFMQLLIDLKNKGEVTDEDFEVDKKNTSGQIHLTLNEVAAQCFVFFLAGFETSATTMTFATLELALNQNVQDKLRNEINEVLSKHDGQITYDAVMEMKYLDRIVNETLRKHPPIGQVPRVCNKRYQVPGTDVVIEPGTKVQIPIYGIQHDPEYYPDPEKFDPDRFTEENKASRPNYTFMPFGEGPRLCIGFRFGLLQAKIGVLTIIRDFKVTLNEKTKTPIQYSKKSFITAVDGGVWLNLQSVSKK